MRPALFCGWRSQQYAWQRFDVSCWGVGSWVPTYGCPQNIHMPMSTSLKLHVQNTKSTGYLSGIVFQFFLYHQRYILSLCSLQYFFRSQSISTNNTAFRKCLSGLPGPASSSYQAAKYRNRATGLRILDKNYTNN